MGFCCKNSSHYNRGVRPLDAGHGAPAFGDDEHLVAHAHVGDAVADVLVKGGKKVRRSHPAMSAVSAEDRAAIGLSDALIRVSVGIEDINDLLEDFDRALAD